jgi:hypothetical protein
MVSAPYEVAILSLRTASAFATPAATRRRPWKRVIPFAAWL